MPRGSLSATPLWVQTASYITYIYSFSTLFTPNFPRPSRIRLVPALLGLTGSQHSSRGTSRLRAIKSCVVYLSQNVAHVLGFNGPLPGTEYPVHQNHHPATIPKLDTAEVGVRRPPSLGSVD